MGDKSPKSKQKNQAQKASKDNAASQAKQRQTDARNQPAAGAPPKKK
ncbi:hypothetical protein [Haloferula sp. BvORR071]|nr:hypothetical protein [Haloferula sp. BvORR071]